MTRKTKRKISTFLRYFVLIAVGIVMVYPLIWMVGATFKTNNEIFSSIAYGTSQRPGLRSKTAEMRS